MGPEPAANQASKQTSKQSKSLASRTPASLSACGADLSPTPPARSLTLAPCQTLPINLQTQLHVVGCCAACQLLSWWVPFVFHRSEAATVSLYPRPTFREARRVLTRTCIVPASLKYSGLTPQRAWPISTRAPRQPPRQRHRMSAPLEAEELEQEE